jgi:hypothetical protein
MGSEATDRIEFTLIAVLMLVALAGLCGFW